MSGDILGSPDLVFCGSILVSLWVTGALLGGLSGNLLDCLPSL
jgi:hypothetical protein